jgi:predicted secreted protein
MKAMLALLMGASGVLMQTDGCAVTLPRNATIVLGQSDGGTSIDVYNQDKLVVVLPVYGATDYSWKVKSGSSSLPALLSLEQDKYLANSTTSAAGPSGVQVLVFEVTGQVGFTTLELSYSGPGGGTGPIATWSIQLHIQD